VRPEIRKSIIHKQIENIGIQSASLEPSMTATRELYVKPAKPLHRVGNPLQSAALRHYLTIKFYITMM